MINDALNMFDPAASVITVTRVSTNVLDMGVIAGLPPSPQGRDMGAGPMVLDVFCQVGAAFAAAGAATLTVALQAALDNGGVPGTWYDQILTAANPVANLVAGIELLRCPLPLWQPAIAGVDGAPRFYRLNYTVATGPMTAGDVQAYLIPHDGRNPTKLYYPSGFSPAN